MNLNFETFLIFLMKNFCLKYLPDDGNELKSFLPSTQAWKFFDWVRKFFSQPQTYDDFIKKKKRTHASSTATVEKYFRKRKTFESSTLYFAFPFIRQKPFGCTDMPQRSFIFVYFHAITDCKPYKQIKNIIMIFALFFNTVKTFVKE